jgi:hypothetical protein
VVGIKRVNKTDAGDDDPSSLMARGVIRIVLAGCGSGQHDTGGGKLGRILSRRVQDDSELELYAAPTRSCGQADAAQTAPQNSRAIVRVRRNAHSMSEALRN